VGGLTGLFEQMRTKFGDTKGYGLSVFTDYAVLDRMDPTEDRAKLNYRYQGGTWGDPTTLPIFDDDTIVDVSAFDLKAIVGILRGAPETLGVKPTDVTNTSLRIEPAEDPTAPGALTVHVSVSTNFGSGHLELDGAGNVKAVNYPG
jgi:hypothetical protein